MNYNAKPLPNIARADLDAGKELIDTGACCPTIFTTGSLVNFLKNEVADQRQGEDLDDYVFLTAGACGPCRFGQYHESYEMALDGMGLKEFRLFLLAQDQLDQAPEKRRRPGNQYAPEPRHRVGHSVGDILTDMEYLTRPYEVNPGQTDKVLQESAIISSRFSRSGRCAATSMGCWRGISSPAISPMRCAWCARNLTPSKSTACK